MGQGQEVHARRLLQQSMAGVSCCRYYYRLLMHDHVSPFLLFDLKMRLLTQDRYIKRQVKSATKPRWYVAGNPVFVSNQVKI